MNYQVSDDSVIKGVRLEVRPQLPGAAAKNIVQLFQSCCGLSNNTRHWSFV